jgi:S1-C subfamily serine protease
VTAPSQVHPAGAATAWPSGPDALQRTGHHPDDQFGDQPGGQPGDQPPDEPPRGLRARLSAVPRRVWIALVVVVVVAAAALAYALTRPPGPAPLTQRDVDASVQRGLEQYAQAESERPADATLAHTTIQPSLVLITTETSTASGAERGSGAGFVVNSDGLVLTANHVIDGAATVTVHFADGTVSPADVASSDPDTDIATLAPQRLPEPVVPAVLGGSVVVGAPVFAVGHPLGLTDSLTAGVVSALDRTVSVPGGRELEHLIQFDAAVNPGNSGGPLLDRAGHVVGVVTGLANPTDQSLFVGIGFAVPIGTAGGAAGSPPH